METDIGKFTAQVVYKSEDRSNPWLPILPGYRAEVVDGLPEGKFIYTGVCATKQEAVQELIAQLKEHGFSGKLVVGR